LLEKLRKMAYMDNILQLSYASTVSDYTPDWLNYHQIGMRIQPKEQEEEERTSMRIMRETERSRGVMCEGTIDRRRNSFICCYCLFTVLIIGSMHTV